MIFLFIGLGQGSIIPHQAAKLLKMTTPDKKNVWVCRSFHWVFSILIATSALASAASFPNERVRVSAIESASVSRVKAELTPQKHWGKREAKVALLQGCCLATRGGQAFKQFTNLFPDDVARAIPRYRLVNQNGKWVTISSSGKVRTASGEYIFVSRGNNTYVTKPYKGGHIDLARGRPVDYAGEITFSGRRNRGTLKSWNNRSGHYQPSASAANQAGLPMDLFNP